ncbi:elongation factor G [Dissulfurirhabdus thermomarina]|uniref:Elongation factor G n=1 Tax=Dissulfurirhabdus thermomarina TaxID=1765737 RepID=A0A6N9TW18_DISTH|nr:elongation factor G [Dissulfurirhabdus thermomarina]NDY42676.1 elongation factor G [Dissulfurirhabdus thermomarina]
MDAERIRNLALVSTTGAGKTSLAEAMLFSAKAVSRLGSVDEGTATLDFEAEETKRKLSITTAFHPLQWRKTTVQLMDTPGEDNFVGETKVALRVADSVVFVVDAVDPVKPQTLKVWSMVRERGLPAVFFVNRMDRERASFDAAVETLKEALELRLVPVAVPIGAAESFRGLVDLVRMKAFLAKDDGTVEAAEIPAEMAETVQELRGNLVEYAAESDDGLLEKFLEGEDLTPEEIVQGLRAGISGGGFVPVCCGAAVRNIGASTLLDLVVDFLPSPVDRGPVTGRDPKTGEEVTREPTAEAPFSALVFKTITDPYAGRLSVLRIFSGTLRPDGNLLNPNSGATERYGQVLSLEGASQKPVEAAGPGQVVALAKLKETATGHTLCAPEAPIRLEFVELPTPVLSYAIKPKSRGDEEKIAQALSRLQEEDLTLKVRRNPQTRELIISGMGQIHIDTLVERMARKFGVQVALSEPRIPYLETISTTKKGVIYRHKKQTGGAGQFAEVHFDISPLPRGRGFEFEEALVGMNVPRNFVPAVEKGLHEAMESGPLAGYPVVDVKVRFYDGKSHEVDSSEMAFKIAAIQCFKKGVLEARPKLLEPIVKMTITVPDDAVGDIIGDLNGRRGKVMGMKPGHGFQVVEALVPLAEVQKYALDLNSLTAGRGTFTMEPAHYEAVPPNLAEKIVAAAKAAKEEG